MAVVATGTTVAESMSSLLPRRLTLSLMDCTYFVRAVVAGRSMSSCWTSWRTMTRLVAGLRDSEGWTMGEGRQQSRWAAFVVGSEADRTRRLLIVHCDDNSQQRQNQASTATATRVLNTTVTLQDEVCNLDVGRCRSRCRSVVCHVCQRRAGAIDGVGRLLRRSLYARCLRGRSESKGTIEQARAAHHDDFSYFCLVVASKTN